MANHFDFYSSLNLSPSDSPTELHNAIQSRLGALQSQGAPIDSAEVQQLLVADQILGRPENRAKYDARLEDPSAPSMGVTELRALGSTGRFPDEGGSSPFAPASARPAKQDPPAASDDGATSVMPAATPSTPAAPDADSSPSIPTPRQEPAFPPDPSSYSAPKADESGPQSPFGQGSRGFSPQSVPSSQPAPDAKAPEPQYFPPAAPSAAPAKAGPAKPLPGPLAPLTSAPVTAKALVFTLLGTGVVGVLGLLGSLITAIRALASTNSEDAQSLDMFLGDGFGDLIMSMSWMLIVPAAVLFAIITLTSVGAADRVLRVPGSLSPITVSTAGVVIALMSLTAAILSISIILTIATALTTIAGIAVIVLAWIPATAPWFTRTA